MIRSSLRSIVGLTVVLAFTAAWASSASGYTFGDGVAQAGSEEMIYDWSTQKCGGDENHIPDIPARAYRDAAGRVQLIDGHGAEGAHIGHPDERGGDNYRIIFPNGTMNDASTRILDCTNIHLSHNSKDPGLYDNWEWLTSFWTNDGNTIHALVHNEYHAWEWNNPPNPNGYPSGDLRGCSSNGFKLDCWYNSITLAKSTNGGQNFNHDAWPAPAHRVASLPYTYIRDTQENDAIGLLQPSNMVKKGSYYYALIRATAYGGQKRGVCAIRTNDLDTPSSWRGWDGNAANDSQEGFTIRFLDRYREPLVNPPDHLCEPVSPDPTGGPTQPSDFKIDGMTESLTYNTFLDRYVVTGTTQKPGGPVGVYYSTSKDLIDWSERKLLLQVTPPWIDGAGCGEDWYYYPSIIDPDSADRNFSTSGQYNYLYLTRQKDDDCPGAYFLDRDLVRIPFRFTDSPRWATGWSSGCPGAFDYPDTSQPPNSYFLSSADRNYSGLQFSYKAETTTSAATASGKFERKGNPPSTCEFTEGDRPRLGYGESDEVWYSGAFVFPLTGFWDKLAAAGGAANVTIARLDGGAPGWASQLLVNKDGGVRFNTNNGTTTTQFLPTLPTIAKDNCWHFLEVYQKLSSDPAKAQNRIRIDGQEYTTATAANFPAGATVPYNRLRAGILDKLNVSNVKLYTDMVGIGYGGPLSSIGCVGVGE
jgi:hypothetical protein